MKSDRWEDRTCIQCQKQFHCLKSRTRCSFCSNECRHASRRVEGAKWRDPEQIRLYMQDYAKRNRQRLNEQSREWRLRNPDKRRSSANLYAHKNRVNKASLNREAVLASAKAATLEQIRSLYTRASHHCVYCGKKSRVLTIDHYDPIITGGDHHISNLIPACKPCNSSKWKNVPEDWLFDKFGIGGLARVTVFMSRRKTLNWAKMAQWGPDFSAQGEVIHK